MILHILSFKYFGESFGAFFALQLLPNDSTKFTTFCLFALIDKVYLVSFQPLVSDAHLQKAGVQTLEKEQTNIKWKRNKYKSYIGDNILIIRSYKIRYTYHCRSKKKIHGGKTKLVFEDLIFPQRDFVCWWNLHLNMPDYLNPFMPSGNKRS